MHQHGPPGTAVCGQGDSGAPAWASRDSSVWTGGQWCTSMGLQGQQCVDRGTVVHQHGPPGTGSKPHVSHPLDWGIPPRSGPHLPAPPPPPPHPLNWGVSSITPTPLYQAQSPTLSSVPAHLQLAQAPPPAIPPSLYALL